MMTHKTALPMTALVICHLAHLRHLKKIQRKNSIIIYIPFRHGESSEKEKKAATLTIKVTKVTNGVGSLAYLTSKRLLVFTLCQGQNIKINKINVLVKTSLKWSEIFGLDQASKITPFYTT